MRQSDVQMLQGAPCRCDQDSGPDSEDHQQSERHTKRERAEISDRIMRSWHSGARGRKARQLMAAADMRNPHQQFRKKSGRDGYEHETIHPDEFMSRVFKFKCMLSDVDIDT